MAELDPDVQSFLDLVAEVSIPPTYAVSVETARKRVREFIGERPVEDVASTESFSVPGPNGSIPLRVYVPGGEGPFPMLVYFHGGGWMTGGLDTHDNICAALTNRAGCITVSVGYRLAPEDPFPAGLADCVAAMRWVERHGDQINGDPERIAVAGDSAGGNLAAAVTLVIRDHGGPALCYQGLCYPAVAAPMIHDFPSYIENATGYFLEMESVRRYYDQYLGSELHVRNGYVAPLLVDDLSELPSATVIVAGFDPLRDEGCEYADRLVAAGVSTDLVEYEGAIHAFMSVPNLLAAGADALDTLGAHLERAFDSAERG